MSWGQLYSKIKTLLEVEDPPQRTDAINHFSLVSDSAKGCVDGWEESSCFRRGKEANK